MSYRAFKRLLGETSLERKCRFLFGGFILLLITGSFWWYARQTEDLAYDQLPTTCRLLVNHIVAHQIATVCRQPGQGNPLAEDAEEEFHNNWEKPWPKTLRDYNFVFLSPTGRDKRPDSEYAQERLKEFLADPTKNEDSQRTDKTFHYYGAIRATHSCLGCHGQKNPDLKEGGLIAAVRISVPTEFIEDPVHFNRAILLSTALVTALFIMGVSYLIVRYVIVKPVKHLKEVSDAISAGELNVRSEIQTGDEFEDLSHAFNRMLRNLVAMQDRLRKVNGDLDRKVDELAQANLALYETNQLKSDFLATMSHELRTPLNSILGFSDVLLSGDQLNDKQQRWVSNIKSSGERLLALINDILDLAKIEAGKMQVRVGEFILANLLSNAVKFTPEGGRVLLKVSLGPPSPGRAVLPGRDLLGLPGTEEPVAPADILLVVSDTGVGITPEEQELVFEKFRQGANPLTREHTGTGLGLSITRELARLLGGEVTLHSELGRGSTFMVRLPLRLAAEPRLEFDLARETLDLSKAQRIDARLYAAPQTTGDVP
ncbi:MAG: HAMP domain-containing protein [Planctomycetes bacterium]|nr:HAMP domain-containing protein [Planctomycetota bacterium]